MDNYNTVSKEDKKNAFTTGVFFIIAAVASIIGLKLYDPVLNNPDYLIMGATHSNQIILGAVFELILAFSATGTGIMLYPYLRKFNESWGFGYVCFRLLEVVFILVGIVSVLALVTLSHSYATANTPNIDDFKTIGTLLKGIHDWTFMLGPNFMLGINTFIYSSIFYKSNLIPKKISVIGMFGAVFILIAFLLEIFGVILQISIEGVLLAIPIFIYEMTLAVWLIRKGFNASAIITNK
jgi:Domain of unknown function (DUF4386)